MLTNLYFIGLLAWKLSVWSPFMVDGQSMEPNLHNREMFLIDRSVDLPVQRGEIVVFSFDQNFYYVKRVIGLPGDYLKMVGNKVYLRGRDGNYSFLNEPYLQGDISGNTAVVSGDERFFEVPAGEYFVLGDNRNHSKDSRFFEYPYVKRADFYGKYVWP